MTRCSNPANTAPPDAPWPGPLGEINDQRGSARPGGARDDGMPAPRTVRPRNVGDAAGIAPRRAEKPSTAVPAWAPAAAEILGRSPSSRRGYAGSASAPSRRCARARAAPCRAGHLPSLPRRGQINPVPRTRHRAIHRLPTGAQGRFRARARGQPLDNATSASLCRNTPPPQSIHHSTSVTQIPGGSVEACAQQQPTVEFGVAWIPQGAVPRRTLASRPRVGPLSSSPDLRKERIASCWGDRVRRPGNGQRPDGDSRPRSSSGRVPSGFPPP